MARKHKHEEHANHEAWAIPYGDLITLLLAFFVVMYSMSSINEGKYRVLADSLNAAFGGAPRSPSPVQVGPRTQNSSPEPRPRVLPGAPPHPGVRGSQQSQQRPDIAGPVVARLPGEGAREVRAAARQKRELERMAEDVHRALGDLIQQKLVVVRRHEQWLEIEIAADILFASGSSRVESAAGHVLDRLAGTLRGFPHPLRIEGHTDNVPIATREFPSNWELSSARAASVVHRFMANGVDPRRMAVLGLAEFRPVAANESVEGRNRNRRVTVVVLAHPDLPPLDDAAPAPEAADPAPPVRPVPEVPAAASVAAAPEHARP